MVFLYCLLGILLLMGACQVSDDIIDSIRKGGKNE